MPKNGFGICITYKPYSLQKIKKKMKNYISSIFLILLICTAGIIDANTITKTGVQSLTSANGIIKKSSGAGFGFEGLCSNRVNTFLENDSFDKVPQALKEGIDIMFQVINAIAGLPQICIGDFVGKYIKSNDEHVNAQCHRFPINDTDEFGVVSVWIPNFVCPTTPDAPMTIGGCLLFDRVGTGAIILNGKLIGCMLGGTGIGNLLAPFMNFVGTMGFGFSLRKKFSKTYNLCYNKDDKVGCSEKTTRGHFMFQLNLGLPTFKIGKKELKDYLSLNVDMVLLLDLGNMFEKGGLGESLIESFSDKEKMKDLPTAIMNAGAEITYCMKGVITIKASDVTNGFMSNISITLAERYFLVTSGNGESGLPAGFYFYQKSDLINSIIKIFNSLIDKYVNCFGLDISIPVPKNTSLAMGAFIDGKSIGFRFILGSTQFQCLYNFDKNRGSCQFKDKFFTAIIEGIGKAAEWVVKSAKKLWDATGKVVTRFAKNVGKFFTNVGKKAKEGLIKAANAAKKAAEAAKKAAEEIKKKAEEAAKKAAEAAKKAAAEVKRKAEEAAKKAAEAAKKAAAAAKKKAEEAAKKAAAAAKKAAAAAKKKAEEIAAKAKKTVKKIFRGW